MQRICNYSTDSFTFLGKIYRFFDEIRRMKDRCFGPEFLSLKAASCLSKFTQTWREKPANSSDMVCFSGKSFRHSEKIRRVPGHIGLAPGSRRAHTSCLARSTVHSQRFRTRNPVSTRNEYRVKIALNLRSHAALTCGVAVAAN